MEAGKKIKKRKKSNKRWKLGACKKRMGVGKTGRGAVEGRGRRSSGGGENEERELQEENE